jgi:penicillin-binding protein 1A
VKVLRFFLVFALIAVLGGAALAGCFALLVPAGAQFADTTSYGPLLPEMNKQSQRSYVLDRNGGVMTTLFAEEDRQPITLADVPQHLIDAVLAIEDRRFYEHDGVDYEGTTRALFQNLDAGEVEQGGSTITQQLVKNTMGDPKKRDLKTKIREAVLAVRLENEMEKDEILERYLNVIYLGNGAYGIKAASERYFDKPDPKQLTIGESALLAGLIQSPEVLNPVTHPDRAARRRATVLDAMLDLDMINEAEARAAREEPLPTEAKSPDRRRDYFPEEVVKQLLNDDPRVVGDVAEYLGPDEQARYNAVFRGGLRITTTYDPVLQWMAATAVADTLPETTFVAAIVVIDNSDGSVRAMFTGKDFSESQFNPITLDGRQTGSSFKGITLATVLDAGYSPNDRVSGSSLHVRRPGDDWDLKCSGGTMTLADATAKSNNCAFGRTIMSLGPGHYGDDGAQRVVDMAGRLGIDTSKLSAVPALTLGASNTNVLDMAEAYSVFANDGIHRTPRFISKIEGPDGKLIYQADTTGERVLSEQVARTETEMLTNVIKSGTGTAARLDRPAAGKTGTTDNNSDAWFVGYTPQFTAAVWMGDWERSDVYMNNVGGRRVSGGSYPAEIWAAFMQPAHQNLPVVQFIAPDERQWPGAQKIDEFGRSYSRDFAERSTPRTSPGTTAPASPESTPPATGGATGATVAPAVGPDTPVQPVPPAPDPAPPGG